LYPDRLALADALQRLIDLRYPLQGASDHGVSEAIYLADPEGNGIELYADRPASVWYRDGEEVEMYTEPLDVSDLLALRRGSASAAYTAPGETRIGHMHLQVSDLQGAGKIATGKLGLEVRQRSYPGALFLAYDHYHHHLGTNTWGVRRAANPGSLGLKSFAFRIAPEILPAAHPTEVELDGVKVELKPAVQMNGAPVFTA
jgi:catechol 2,3-dioxygenase